LVTQWLYARNNVMLFQTTEKSINT